jgi:hypothetical protein
MPHAWKSLSVGSDTAGGYYKCEHSPLILDHASRWQVTLKNFTNRYTANKTQLVAEANNNSKNKRHDEELKSTESCDRPIWAVKEKDQEDIED